MTNDATRLEKLLAEISRLNELDKNRVQEIQRLKLANSKLSTMIFKRFIEDLEELEVDGLLEEFLSENEQLVTRLRKFLE